MTDGSGRGDPGGTTELIWCDPPPSPGRGLKETEALIADLALLDDRPGEWCRLRTFDTVHGASNLRNRLRKHRAADPYDFATRRLGPSSSGLWAMRRAS